MGYFNRAAIMTNSGIQIGDIDHPPTPEQISESIDQINDMGGAKEFNDLNSALFDLMSPPASDAPKDDNSGGPSDGLTVKDIFDKMPEAFNPEAAKGIDIVFQYNISGKTGGEWMITIKDGSCTVESGKANKPNCTLNIGDTDFLDMISGKLDPMKAFTSGKLTIDGDIMKSQLIGKLFKM
jgi:putative sterol carrier protein